MDYVAGTGKDFERDTPKYFSWMTEPPMQEGLYWAKHNDYGIIPVELRDPHGYRLAWLISEDIPSQVEEFSRWLGPLPPPEEPK